VSNKRSSFTANSKFSSFEGRKPEEIVVDLNKIPLIKDICTEKNWIVSN